MQRVDAGPLDRSVIAQRLRELGAYLRVVEAEPYRARAYENGAAAVDALGDRFDALATAGRLTDVPGIGPSLAAAIDELRRTGTHRRLDELRATLAPGLLELADLPGLTRARLFDLQDRMGITGAAELRDALETGRLGALKGFGPKTQDKLREALARAADARPALLLVEARAFGQGLCTHALGRQGVRRAELAGAARRGHETVDAIELVVASDAPDAVIDGLAGWPHVSAARRTGPDRAEGRLSNGLALVVVVVPPARFGGALVTQTGSDRHVQALAARAAARGAALADLVAAEEAELYAVLGLPPIPPELREGEGEIELADGGDDFSDLVTLSDLRGVVHCHTTYSDGRNSVEEMALAAQARGLEYLTITDHSTTASYAGGLTPERLQEQAEEIARVQTGVQVRLLRGTESDILADGALDFSDDLLAGLDVVIASVHNRYQQTREQATERLVRTMGLPLFKLWGHALGRLLLRRDPIDCDVEAVLDAAAAGRVAIEMNGDPNRLDMAPHWARQARRRGLRFVISADAHAIDHFGYLANGVVMARRAGIRRGEVLNTLDAEGFADAVRP